MDEERNHGQATGFVAGLALGALLGAGTALLLAPYSGRRARKRIVRTAEDLSESARERVEETGEDVKRAARDAVRAAERRGARLRESVRRGRQGDDG